MMLLSILFVMMAALIGSAMLVHKFPRLAQAAQRSIMGTIGTGGSLTDAVDNYMDSPEFREMGAASMEQYIIVPIGIMIFCIMLSVTLPTALTNFYQVDVGNWTHTNPTTGVVEQDTTAILFWNLLPWMLIIFGGLLSVIYIVARRR